MSRKKLSLNQQKNVIGLVFLFAVLAATGILVNVPPIWRILNALVWIIFGIYMIIQYKENNKRL